MGLTVSGGRVHDLHGGELGIRQQAPGWGSGWETTSLP